MFYRVDYLLAVLVAGFLIGLACSRWSAQLAPARIARAYLGIVVALLGLRAVFFAASVVRPHLTPLSTAGGIISDIGSLLFGALFGVALRRADRRALLLDPAIYSALCLATGFTFAMAGIAKAFAMEGMIQFFQQSGYSPSFLKCIMIAEVFGGLAMLIPWAVLPAVAGLSIDMFGAISTHVHNGDPLNDSTGAIGALLRLGTIAILSVMARSAHRDLLLRDAPLRGRLLGVAAGAIACLLFAIVGGVVMRHIAHP